MPRKTSPNQQSNTANIAITASVITVIGVIATAYFNYLSTRTQIELPINATQTAEARLFNANTILTSQTAPTAISQNLVTPAFNPVDDIVATLTQAAKIVYNPTGGLIPHSKENVIDGSVRIGVNLKNFIVEVKFYNPYGIDEGKWDYGISFRSLGVNENYRLFTRYDSTWILYLGENPSGNRSNVVIEKGYIRNLDLWPNGSNIIRLVVNDKTAYFFVNDVFIKELDISARTLAGDIELGTGFDAGNKISGRVTRYEGFTVWSLP